MRDLSVPTVPSQAVQVRMAQETAERQAAAGQAASLPEGTGAPEALRRQLSKVVDALRPELVALSHDIHAHPETGYEEHHAVGAVAEILRRHGLVPEVGVYGMDTALRAETGGAGRPGHAGRDEPGQVGREEPGQARQARLDGGAPGGRDGAAQAGRPRSAAAVPTIAVLCEYDALPGIGHGCGHNVMCASSVGAFLALAALDRQWRGSQDGDAASGREAAGARLESRTRPEGQPGRAAPGGAEVLPGQEGGQEQGGWSRQPGQGGQHDQSGQPSQSGRGAGATPLPGGLPGRVILQTTPAEENSTAKEILATRGMLEGVDAAIQTHSYAADVTHQTWLGVRRLTVVFHGVPAHASSQPFMGRNALDAATLALTGFGLLRQHMLPMDRLHAVVVDGGEVANIIPERAELSVMVRSKYPETLKDVVGRVEEVLHGAALMTGTGVEIRTDPFTNEMPVRDNGPLLESWVRAQRERGRDPLPAGVVSETIAAGTDFGNVSQRVPGIHPLVKVTQGPDVALHTRQMAEAAASPTGDDAVVDGAYGLAAVALDWLWDAGLREAVRADFEASGGVVDVEGFWEQPGQG